MSMRICENKSHAAIIYGDTNSYYQTCPVCALQEQVNQLHNRLSIMEADMALLRPMLDVVQRLEDSGPREPQEDDVPF